MDEKELRDLLSKRLYIELQLFKDSILQQAKEEIYKSSYKIEVYVNAYEILLEGMEDLEKDMMHRLLYRKDSILEALYQEWFARAATVFEELKTNIGSGLEAIIKADSSDHGKEKRDGTEPDQDAQGR